MSLSEAEISRVMSLRLTPCWRTLGLLLPILIAGVVLPSEAGEPHRMSLLGKGLIGFAFFGLSISFVFWTDEWAEFGRRPRAWVVKYFDELEFMFPFSAPEWIRFHRNGVRVNAFVCGLIGVGFLLGTILNTVGITKLSG